MNNGRDRDEFIIKIVTVVALAVVLLFAIVGMTLVALTTDRNLARAETYTLIGIVVVGGLGGLTLWSFRKRKWHIQVDSNGGVSGRDKAPPPEGDGAES